MALLAWTYTSDARYGWSRSPDQSWNKALELANEAVAMDEFSAEAHAALAFLQLWTGDHANALERAKRAIALNPNGSDEYFILAMINCYCGRPDEAAQLHKQALRLNPLSPTNVLIELGRANCQTGRYAEAIGPLEGVVAQRPYWTSSRILLALAYTENGAMKKAAQQVAEVLRINPRFSIAAEIKTHPYKNEADRKRFADGLRKAGLPE